MLLIVTANYLISTAKVQPTTGVTSLFFLFPFLMKNGYYAELRDWPVGYLGRGEGEGGWVFVQKKYFGSWYARKK